MLVNPYVGGPNIGWEARLCNLKVPVATSEFEAQQALWDEHRRLHQFTLNFRDYHGSSCLLADDKLPANEQDDETVAQREEMEEMDPLLLIAKTENELEMLKELNPGFCVTTFSREDDVSVKVLSAAKKTIFDFSKLDHAFVAAQLDRAANSAVFKTLPTAPTPEQECEPNEPDARVKIKKVTQKNGNAIVSEVYVHKLLAEVSGFDWIWAERCHRHGHGNHLIPWEDPKHASNTLCARTYVVYQYPTGIRLFSRHVC
jgi:hypothetical protein